MRKGIDSLCGIVHQEFKMDPLSGDVFVFFSRRRDRIKLLQWQQDGFALFFKRLEKGTYEVPNDTLLSAQQLMFIMEGISLTSVKKRKRYHHLVVNNNQVAMH